MDFSLSPELIDLQARVRAFIAEEIMPFERDPRCTPHGPNEALRAELVAKGRKAGLLSSHVSPEFGGLGLNHVAKAILFEEAGYSPLGPVALNIAAPDEGNMHLLEAIATPQQKERWLRPLAAGEIRSCFCMTEPPPGAGADPAMLQTTAAQDGDEYVIDGRKWFITGAEGAAVAIIMAKFADGPATMFLADMSSPGIVIERAMDSRAFPAATASCASRACACRKRTYWASRVKGFVMRKCGSRPRVSRTACAGSAPRGARTMSRRRMRGSVRRSAVRWASTKASASCSRTTKWICT
jgi:alkylation response protein AidB-like acyl-CoA dehydrogenase